MTVAVKPPTIRQRRRMSFGDYGKRPLNAWWDGDLPSPYAIGDLLRLDDPHPSGRLRTYGLDGGPGFYVVCTAFSIGEGDEWYFRVCNDPDPFRATSDRLHVIPGSCDYMAPFTLVETSDPEGLALRERMLADGWTPPPPPETCPTCGRLKL